ncbi:ABC transporter permease [Brachybacterium halotolerans subsp. kimchii]|uniref:ABC transporter permease n=1 Tax=Brachybacterium halotolerans TaxID=2795215 RepID=A0ABS1BD02_9MICO|nr:ABC transporter permease [Brachybacterium halotolerans]MBK0332533.1 ABC transporter permease [Brachybacterium halotolerans]UEJ82121.1 ABC transporter permease [Brachybacterium halotolerans subsp. kimchii]
MIALKRVGQAVLVIALAYVLVFLVLAAIPGDPVSAQLENPQAGYSEAEKAQIRSFYGLDKPVLVQLLISIGNALRGDLGISLSTSAPVSSTIGEAIPSTLALAATALVFALLIALILGFASQSLGEGRLGGLVRSLPTVFLSTPNFLIGLVLIQVFAVQLGAFSIIDPETAGSTAFAALTLAIPVSAQIAQVFITALDTTTALDHTEVALSRGLAPVRVFARHLLRPSLLPTVTVCGLVVGELLGGSLITETIFGRAGIGTVVQKAVTSQDVPVLQAAVVLSAAVFVGVNLVIDLVLPLLDPRLRAPREAS